MIRFFKFLCFALTVVLLLCHSRSIAFCPNTGADTIRLGEKLTQSYIRRNLIRTTPENALLLSPFRADYKVKVLPGSVQSKYAISRDSKVYVRLNANRSIAAILIVGRKGDISGSLRKEATWSDIDSSGMDFSYNYAQFHMFKKNENGYCVFLFSDAKNDKLAIYQPGCEKDILEVYIDRNK